MSHVLKDKKIFIAGHLGMVGSAIRNHFEAANIGNIVTANRSELDLTDQVAVRKFMRDEQPECIIIAAARVGGIHANNTYPADFIYQNLMIECNLIHGAYENDVKHLLFLGSSCIYPKITDQPIPECALLSGALEPTNEPYAIAKIAGIKLCESYNRQYDTDYRSIMPSNLYGPGDYFSLENSHVIPSLLLKFHNAKINRTPKVEIWGTGKARREFLHVDDLASAAITILGLPKNTIDTCAPKMRSHINIGLGYDISIKELAELTKEIVGYEGGISYDTSKPDGTLKKLMDNSLAESLGWKPRYNLPDGLTMTYDWFCKNIDKLRI